MSETDGPPEQRFIFRQSWSLPASTAEVYAVLAAVADYPSWWSEVRSVRQITEKSAALQIRSFLPYTLQLVLTREVEDPVSGLLRVSISGDLDGWSQWQLEEQGEVCVAQFAQDVVVSGEVLGRMARVASPLLRANHAAMMRSGQRGLAWLLGEQGSDI